MGFNEWVFVETRSLFRKKKNTKKRVSVARHSKPRI